MVCFAQFRYNVSKKDLDNFVVNANHYFPGVKWAVSCGDMTINSTNLYDAVKRLNPSDTDTIVFDTGRIWDSLSFWQALPRMKPCDVSQEVRQRLSQQVKVAINPYDHEAENVGQQLDWTTVPQFMTLVHEQTPIVSYYALPSENMIVYESEARSPEPGLRCIYVKDGKFTFTYGPRVVFDIDDGFMNAHGDGPVPKEFTNAFQKWVANNRVGPVLA